MNLIELAERVEKATGPDRGLDIALVEACGWQRRGGFWMGEYWARGGERIWLSHIPQVTASVDAAMTLVPDGWGWTLDHQYVVSKQPYVAFILHPDRMKMSGLDRRADAATAALALTAACLRAMAEPRA